MNRPNDGTPTAGATAVQTQPQDDALKSAVARAKDRIEAGDLEGGLSAFRDIAESNPAIPEVFNNLGAICAAMGRHEEAEQAFGRAGELTPDAPNPWYNRGLMRFQSGNYLGALEDFERAGTLDPDDAEFLNNQGVVHFQLQDWEKARSCFGRAVELRPDYTAAHLNLVDVDLAENHVEQAYQRCQALASEHADTEIQTKWVECGVARVVDAIDRVQTDCESLQANGGAPREVLDQAGRLLRAKQLLLDDQPVTATPW
jgi:Flp pilus assembly protein TadD